MASLVQTILVPVIDKIPHNAIAYAGMLSKVYDKPVALLYLNPSLKNKLQEFNCPTFFYSEQLNIAINKVIDEQDPVMIVFESGRNVRMIWQQLTACRNLRIPYWFVPSNCPVKKPDNVVLPVSFLIEDREKATWGRSFSRYFDSHFVLLKPQDKGTRAAKNINHIEEFFDKNNIVYKTLAGRKSSLKINREAIKTLSDSADLFIITASRDYGLDDYVLGPKELHLIRRSHIPLMLINPRGDLYILCGD